MFLVLKLNINFLIAQHMKRNSISSKDYTINRQVKRQTERFHLNIFLKKLKHIITTKGDFMAVWKFTTQEARSFASFQTLAQSHPHPVSQAQVMMMFHQAEWKWRNKFKSFVYLIIFLFVEIKKPPR